MSYFRSFPKILYSFDFKNQSPTIITNILARFKVKSEVLNNAFAYYKYQIKDGDTPEIVAYQQYGDPNLFWIICLVNELEDPIFDFPMEYRALERYIINKYNYTAIEESYAATHHYELSVENKLLYTSGVTISNTTNHIVTLEQYNYTNSTLEVKSLGTTTQTSNIRSNVADPTSANIGTATITSTYKAVSVFDYELAQNELKRSIKLLKPQYVQAISKELENILKE